MSFFGKVKDTLENALNDVTTLEHALIVDENEQYIYQFQQFDGDSPMSFS